MGGSIPVELIFAILGGFAALVGILAYFERRRRNQEGDIKDELSALNNAIDRRLLKLETRTDDFMPKSEITYKVDHERNNRIQGELALRDLIRRNTDDIVTLRLDHAKLEERGNAVAAAIKEVKEMVRESGAENKVRFDKLENCIASLDKKVG